MKTADLIPFILLELADCDKYGFELTKNIETKSNGKIVIKQPTLYTLLKKLEKSKFITSYWQDSEIGGKRHYYKLTDNGRLQVSTLPSYDFLIKSALDEEIDENEVAFSHSNFTFEPQKEEKTISIMDELLNQHTSTPVESILPSNEVFNESNVDTTTELEQNIANADMLKNESVTTDENFASNADVATFTEKIKHENKVEITNHAEHDVKHDILNTEFTAPHSDLEIAYVDYKDFKNSKENLYAKKIVHKKLLQILATCGSLIVMLALCELITLFTSRSALYYFFFIGAILILIFYPVLYLVNMDKLRLKYQHTTYAPKMKQQIIIGISIALVILITNIIVSVSVGKSSIGALLSYNNFANMYAPILMFSPYFFNILFNYVIVLKSNK